ncbi:hypothetical protein HBF26_18225 [Luteibacter jiangsuensis]|uniref:Uncharacterized protein n=1 Tax=Luteibacter jiangsuensis TaxID=637577 RepID=A0ABX0Q8K0_9GAMM|nr:hypothetical protein [Luteibacter jiangsuensis]NID06829.1 hypothetical protein [Luteibacter jiangsuensis]
MPDVKGTWSSTGLRATAFFAPGTPKLNELSLLGIFGIEPEQVTAMPAQKSRFEMATMGLGHLNLQVQSNRADLIWSATPSAPGQIGDLGELDEVVESLVTPFEQTLGETGSPVHRLAIGGIRTFVADDQDQIVPMLRGIFPRLELDDDISDFFFSINRPVMGEVDGFKMKINRIMKWSQMQSSGLQFEVTPNGLVQQAAPPVFGVALEFDVNTHPGNNLFFTEGSISAVFDSLRGELGFVTAVPANV